MEEAKQVEAEDILPFPPCFLPPPGWHSLNIEHT